MSQPTSSGFPPDQVCAIIREERAGLVRALAALKLIAEEPDGPWKTVLAWQAYKREGGDLMGDVTGP